MGNPFSNDFFEFINLTTETSYLPQTVSNDLYKMEDEGKKLIVKTVHENRTTSVHDLIKKNSFALFKRPN